MFPKNDSNNEELSIKNNTYNLEEKYDKKQRRHIASQNKRNCPLVLGEDDDINSSNLPITPARERVEGTKILDRFLIHLPHQKM